LTSPQNIYNNVFNIPLNIKRTESLALLDFPDEL